MPLEDDLTVYWVSNTGYRHKEMSNVTANEAWKAVTRLTSGPSLLIDVVKEVLITDKDDYTCFLWQKGKIIFPTKKDIEDYKKLEKP